MVRELYRINPCNLCLVKSVYSKGCDEIKYLLLKKLMKE